MALNKTYTARSKQTLTDFQILCSHLLLQCVLPMSFISYKGFQSKLKLYFEIIF